MGHDHSHAQQVEGNERRITWALAMTSLFFIVEVIGGIVTDSLALLSDAAHMFTDVTALAISLAAVKIGKKAVDDRRTYGYQRFEILAAAFNAMMLFAVAIWILYEAYRRFMQPPEVNSSGMLIVAVIGFVVNLISMKLLSGGREESLNVKGAYLEVWSDLLGSGGVIAAAILIKVTGWLWLDPLVAVGIGLWVLPRTWTLLKQSTNILLEGTPADVDMDCLRVMVEGTPGVIKMHDLHVWTLTSGRHVLTAHVIVGRAVDRQATLEALSKAIKSEFKIFHTTIQLEDELCEDLHAAPGDGHKGHVHDDGHGHDH